MRVTQPIAPAADPVASLRAASGDAAATFRAGMAAMNAHCEEAALPLLRSAATRFSNDPRIHQVLGLVARTLEEPEIAVAAFARARALAPADALIGHSAARTRLEAGLPAIDDFLSAQRLAPADGAVLLGLAAARLASGDIEGAIDGIDAIVRQQPLWLDGHATLARLRRLAGDPDPFASYHQALARQPGAAPIWQALLATLATARAYPALARAVAQARQAAPATPGLALYEAMALDETGEHARAGALFDAPGLADDPAGALWRVRSLLRRGLMREAADFAAARVDPADRGGMWPYLALAWRLLDDPRHAWLEGDPAFVRVFDLAERIGDLDALAARLRTLHVAREQPLDQSVRQGTQTDGPLFARAEPEVRALRAVVREAVADYIADLPAPDPRHPLLSARRDLIRFAGSWSVRLTGGGHHDDHLHTHGWISSALYVSLPPDLGGEERAGWLTLGTSRDLLPDLPAFRTIEPRPGRLVLFPSTMWHGTNPFTAGERLTVAFDVARMG
jgi:hypothetical protein